MKIKFNEFFGYLKTPTFLQSDVVEITQINPGLLQHWVNRKKLNLPGVSGGGQGKRRLYSIKNVVTIELALQMTMAGLPINVAGQLAENMAGRTMDIALTGDPKGENLVMHIIPDPDHEKGEMDWKYISVYERPAEGTGNPDVGKPPVSIVIRCDEIISGVIDRITELINSQA